MMKRKLQKAGGLITAGAMALTLMVSPLGVNAQDGLKPEDFKKKLSVDEAPISQTEHVVTSYADMLEQVTPSVVTISSRRAPDPRAQEMMEDPMFRRFFQFPPTPDDRAMGSGIIITEDGYILTNNHVVEQAEKIEVHIDALNSDYDAELIAADPKSDVALIKIGAKGLKPVTIGNSKDLRVGDVTFAIGNPFGLAQTVTMGVVSALGRSSRDVPIIDYADLIQTDASINQGNSGGALVDAYGRLIGINTAIHSRSGGSVGIGFAIPVHMAMDIVDRLLEGDGVVRRGFLGVQLQPLDKNLAEGLKWKEHYGAMVADVVPGTPADRAGFKPYDIITGFEGERATNADRLRLRISNTPPDREVSFNIFRDGKDEEVKLKLGELPTSQELASLVGGPEGVIRPGDPVDLIEGVKIVDVSDANREEFGLAEDAVGVVVAEVDPESEAADSGLRAGQIIIEVDQRPVESASDAAAAMADFDGDVLLLRVAAAGSRSMLAVPLSK